MFPMPPPPQPGAARPTIVLIGHWRIRIDPGYIRAGGILFRVRRATELEVAPSSRITVTDEKHESAPRYDANAAPWTRGLRFLKLITCETTGPDLLDPDSVVLRTEPGTSGRTLVRGTEWEMEPRWATFGTVGDTPPPAPLYASYTCGLHRIDAVVIDRQGRVTVRTGVPHAATPIPPAIAPGEARLANLWIPGRADQLTDQSLFPVLETAYPAAPRGASLPAAATLPRTLKRLQAGESLRVLAWGDSVTAGGQASDEAHRWQDRFVAHLRTRFPRATITLETAGWGGRNSDSFLNEPPDSPNNFERAVIARKPDLIVMEFVNDAGFTPEIVERKYSSLLKRFQEIGAEWCILTPHLVWNQWMGLSTVKVSEDPRPYVAGVRAFCARHGVALADASLRWCHLVKEGLPYMSLLSNSLNHPDDRGHELFALAIMDLFGGTKP